MERESIRGIIPAVITPMTESEALDEAGLKRLIGRLIERGVHGIFTGGTAGESWALSVEEKRRLYEWTVNHTGHRVPVYLGTAANTTREAVLLAEYAQEAGADCLSILTPYFITPGDEELYDHFGSIAMSVDLPILLYDLPARTGNPLSVDLVLRLADGFANIVGIKDSSGDFTQTIEYLRRAPDGFRVIMGRDTLIYAALSHGAAGAIAASASVAPELSVGIYESYVKGDLASALDFQRRLAPLRQAFSIGTHPAMLKAGAELVGLPCGPPRAPVRPLSQEERDRLRTVLAEMGTL
ncbi:MAG: 4-hydroxy-tetrahydrodipicolinate synthase [Candidatus Latescibacteria bacterium]|jgi:4-hydroxy-tetrahydrodipicolinate synthase|nr:4-hydroxy-tetrahydrodipicolinate synthase [Candidatus Latescibacterota bacterium]